MSADAWCLVAGGWWVMGGVCCDNSMLIYLETTDVEVGTRTHRAGYPWTSTKESPLTTYQLVPATSYVLLAGSTRVQLTGSSFCYDVRSVGQSLREDGDEAGVSSSSTVAVARTRFRAAVSAE